MKIYEVLLMGLKTEKWTLAYRKKHGFDNISEPYIKIKGDKNGWYADPFLFEHNGTTYLFAEYFSYLTVKGSIVYSIFNKDTFSFSEPKEIISEDFHMSYPNVFTDGSEIYMLPETAEAHQLILYKAVSFPDKWEKYKIIAEDAEYVDTTLVSDFCGQSCAVTYKLKDAVPEKFLLIDLKTGQIVRDLTDLRALETARPAGKLCRVNGKTVLPTQDCSETYGGAIIFCETNPEFCKFEKIFCINQDNIKIKDESSEICGVHTYNSTDELEIIDYKTLTVSPIRIFNRVLQKAGIKK